MLFIGAVIAVVIFIFVANRIMPVKVDRTKWNRNLCESYIERRLYDALVFKGYPVRSQVKCGPYRIDLVIGNLAIECDGAAYHSSAEQVRRDQRKDRYLRRQGYKVVRFSGSAINSRLPSVLEKISQKIQPVNPCNKI